MATMANAGRCVVIADADQASRLRLGRHFSDAGFAVYVAEDMRQRTDHGCVGYPQRASAEKGRAFLNAAIERTAEVVQALLRRRLPE